MTRRERNDAHGQSLRHATAARVGRLRRIARVTERSRIPSPPASSTAHAPAASSVTAHLRLRAHRQPEYDGRGAGTPIAEEVDHPIDPARAIGGEHEHPPPSPRAAAQPEQSLHCVLPSCVHGVRCFRSDCSCISCAAIRRSGSRRLTDEGGRQLAIPRTAECDPAQYRLKPHGLNGASHMRDACAHVRAPP